MEDASFLEDLLDPSKCNKLRMEEKRELVYKLSKMSNFSPEMLQSWSRQDILEILCAEMGKERKYTGLTKLRIIENLLRIVAEKRSLENGSSSNYEFPSSSSEKGRPSFKRQRKADHPNHFPDTDLGNIIYCKNLACRARLSREDLFCKRCSCCICLKYDDNKDPSLWLVCCSDPPFQHTSCGVSCHLECAIRHESSGIAGDRQDEGINGSFHCVSCGKLNDLLSCLRKQLVTARDTRRVDILCYRISLSQKLIGEAKSENELYTVVDEAVKKLEEEVGPLTGSPVKTARGIVNRLSSGPEVQRLCGLAVEYLDSVISERALIKVPDDPILQDSNLTASKLIRLEDISASSVTVILSSEESSLGNVVGYTLWHRKADDVEYPVDPTCTLFAPSTRFAISGLTPATKYLLKVVSLDSKRELGMFELRFQTREAGDELSHPQVFSAFQTDPQDSEAYISPSPPTNCSSPCDRPRAEDEIISRSCYTVNVACTKSPKETAEDAPSSSEEEAQMGEETSTDNGSNTPPETGNLEGGLPITPFKTESRFQLGGEDVDDASKKRSGERGVDKECELVGDKELEYYVKVIRWLECGGHIGAAFRQKFLTWYSLRATAQQVRVVKAFVDTLIKDPESLAEQLVHTFSDLISNKTSSSVVPAGFCLRLWH